MKPHGEVVSDRGSKSLFFLPCLGKNGFPVVLSDSGQQLIVAGRVPPRYSE